MLYKCYYSSYLIAKMAYLGGDWVLKQPKIGLGNYMLLIPYVARLSCVDLNDI